MDVKQKSNEMILFEEFICVVKFGMYIPIFFYVYNIIKEHNMLMKEHMSPCSYICDDCVDKENLQINDNNNELE